MNRVEVQVVIGKFYYHLNAPTYTYLHHTIPAPHMNLYNSKVVVAGEGLPHYACFGGEVVLLILLLFYCFGSFCFLCPGSALAAKQLPPAKPTWLDARCSSKLLYEAPFVAQMLNDSYIHREAPPPQLLRPFLPLLHCVETWSLF